MGGQVCESVSCSACDLDGFGNLVFGPQTRNLHPGGSWRGGFESGGWQCRGPEGGRKGCVCVSVGGVRMGCLSSSSLTLLPPSACVQLLQLSVSPLTLSGSHRREFKGPLLFDCPARTIAASQRTLCSDTETQTHPKRFTREFSLAYFHVRV